MSGLVSAKGAKKVKMGGHTSMYRANQETSHWEQTTQTAHSMEWSDALSKTTPD
jgi:hypothetical protein